MKIKGTQNPVVDLLGSFASHGIGAEIGIASGATSSHILRRTNIKFLYLVDPWISGYSKMPDGHSDMSQKDMDQMYQGVLELSKQFSDRTKIIKKTSLEASKDIEDDSLDFVYIDACHDYEDVLQDLKCWVPKVKPGKLIMGDDWSNRFIDGVQQAIIDYARTYDNFIGPISDYTKFNLAGDYVPCPGADPVVNKAQRKHKWWTLKKL